MKYPCLRCGGRGWLSPKRPGIDWPVSCECRGAPLTGPRLARMLRVRRQDVYRVERLQAGTDVGTRVLNAIERVFPGELGLHSLRDRV